MLKVDNCKTYVFIYEGKLYGRKRLATSAVLCHDF